MYVFLHQDHPHIQETCFSISHSNHPLLVNTYEVHMYVPNTLASMMHIPNRQGHMDVPHHPQEDYVVEDHHELIKYDTFYSVSLLSNVVSYQDLPPSLENLPALHKSFAHEAQLDFYKGPLLVQV